MRGLGFECLSPLLSLFSCNKAQRSVLLPPLRGFEQHRVISQISVLLARITFRIEEAWLRQRMHTGALEKSPSSKIFKRASRSVQTTRPISGNSPARMSASKTLPLALSQKAALLGAASARHDQAASAAAVGFCFVFWFCMADQKKLNMREVQSPQAGLISCSVTGCGVFV